MKKHIARKLKAIKTNRTFLLISSVVILVLFYIVFVRGGALSYSVNDEKIQVPVAQKTDSIQQEKLKPLDTADYDKRIVALANIPPAPVVPPKLDPKTGKPLPVSPAPKALWPVKTMYPNDGAILPFKRIIAYYGNLYSTKMGVLGEYKEDDMLQRLDAEVKKWEQADPTTPVMPALHYIAVTAQGSPGEDGKYRLRMPDKEIDKVLAIAEKIHAIVFLDIQVGLSTVETEVPRLAKYLKMPNVHLGLDPEFSMKTGVRPGKVVGTMDAVDINNIITYLAKIVKDNNLPPKVLVIHRYTQKMLTNYKAIKTVPEVQIVIHMDGWGGQAKKINTYKQFVAKEPVQFTGFKLFYKNDIFDKGTVIMKPEDILKLSPKPIYIQYQ